MRRSHARVWALCIAVAWFASAVRAEEPDHAIHEELRRVLREVVLAMNTGEYDNRLPYRAENIEATSVRVGQAARPAPGRAALVAFQHVGRLDRRRRERHGARRGALLDHTVHAAACPNH